MSLNKVVDEMHEDQKKDFVKSISLKSLKDIRDEGYPKLNWRVEKLVPDRGIVIFGGSAGSFKTWCAMQLALAVSSGTQFIFNYNTKKGNVLYIDEENGEITLPNRFDLITKGHDLKHEFENLHVSMFNNFKLDCPNKLKILEKIIQLYDIKLVIVDSMVRCMLGDENKALDVRQVFDNLKNVFKKYEELVFVILHHTTKGRKNGMDSLRGSGDFAGMSDVVLMFNSFNKKINVEIVKNRHLDLTNNRFSIEVLETNTNGLSFGYLPYKEANDNIIIDCYNTLLSYFESNSLREFRSGELWKDISKLGFKKNTFYEAISQLLEDEIIDKLKRGHYLILNQEIKEELV